MIVIGVGGQDSRAEAESFAAAYGGPPNMLWSDSLVAWRHYRATNPYLVLLDGAGDTEIDRQSGFDQRRLEQKLAELA